MHLRGKSSYLAGVRFRASALQHGCVRNAGRACLGGVPYPLAGVHKMPSGVCSAGQVRLSTGKTFIPCKALKQICRFPSKEGILLYRFNEDVSSGPVSINPAALPAKSSRGCFNHVVLSGSSLISSTLRSTWVKTSRRSAIFLFIDKHQSRY